MGQAKQKSLFFKKLDSVCTQGEQTGTGTSYVVHVTRRGVDEMRTKLGRMSDVFEMYLGAWNELNGQDDTVFEWVLRPSGKEVISYLENETTARKEGVNNVFSEQSVRCTNVRHVAFNGAGGWPEVQEVNTAFDGVVKDCLGKKEASPQIKVKTFPNMGKGGLVHVAVPWFDDEDMAPGVAMQLISLMDGMVETKKKAIENRNALVLSFDGYEEDKREVFDIACPKRVLSSVALALPWWPWVCANAHFDMWVASLAGEGKTLVTDKAGLVLQLNTKMVDASAKAVGEGLRDLLMSFHREADEALVEMISKRAEEFYQRVTNMVEMDRLYAAGKVTLADGHVVATEKTFWESMKDHVGDEDHVSSAQEMMRRMTADGASHVGFIVDRSAKGLALFKMMEEVQQGIHSMVDIASHGTWLGSESDLLVVISKISDGQVWSASCKNDIDVLGNVLAERVKDIAADGDVTVAWTLSIEAIDEEDIKKLIDRISALGRSGKSHDDGKELSSSLLDLALAQTGQEINGELIEYLNPQSMKRSMDFQLLALRSMVEEFPNSKMDDLTSVVGQFWVRENGDLACVAKIDGVLRETVTKAGEWRKLSEKELHEAGKVFEKKLASGELDDVIGEIGKSMSDTESKISARQEMAKNAWTGIDLAIAIYAKETNSLSLLKSSWSEYANVMEVCERWLACEDKFMLVGMEKASGTGFCLMNRDLSELLSTMDALKVQYKDLSKSLLRNLCSDAEVILAVDERWKSLGGFDSNALNAFLDADTEHSFFSVGTGSSGNTLH